MISILILIISIIGLFTIQGIYAQDEGRPIFCEEKLAEQCSPVCLEEFGDYNQEYKKCLYDCIDKRIDECSVEQQWERYEISGEFFLPNNQRAHQIVDVPYRIFNGEVQNIIHDPDALSVVIEIKAKDDGFIEVSLPRLVIDSKLNNEDDSFFVLVNGEEIKFKEVRSECFRTLTIQFDKNISHIEVIGGPFTSRAIVFDVSPNCFTKPSPKQQLENGVLPEEIICKDGLELIFKSTDGSPACVKPKTAEKLIERGWGIKNYMHLSESLQTCSRIPGEIIECPAGFVCYEELSGGLGPPGTVIPIESIGGDKLCHKECFVDSDCSSETPVCLFTDRMTEDYSEAFFLCFSEDEGKKVRDKKFESCLQSKENEFNVALEKDGKIFDIGDPPMPHKAEFNGAMVEFLPYMVNNLNLDIKQVLNEEYGLEVIRMGGNWIMIVSLPEQNEVETFCTLELDNRIMDTTFNIDWKSVEP